MISLIIILLIILAYIIGQSKNQQAIRDFEMQEMRCKHCIFKPKFSVLNGGYISICPHRESEKLCGKDSIIAVKMRKG